jgi:NAD(P)-dependent dehydrogenase (short-subunit alcohol dehydrogenase family)/uncharacterized OB-fold protein
MSDVPAPRNPLRRTRLPISPPRARSRRAHIYTKAAAEGRFLLQRCTECGLYLYPAREACPSCLSADLPPVEAPRGGVVVSETTIRVPADLYFRERAPWRIGVVRLACGPTMISHLHAAVREGEAVVMSFRLDKSGQAVAFAAPAGPVPADRQLREFIADPQHRRVLVTDGRSAVGQEVALALVAAGARLVHVGIAEAWKPFAGEERLRGVDALRIVPLDIASEASVMELAADIAGKTDILVNTADHVRPGGLLTRAGTGHLRGEIEQSYRGFVHLAQSFGPAMLARGADGIDNAVAWVNILSVYALANWPAYGSHSAAQAACLSLSHCLRAELRPGGVRVVNLFTGPVDTEWFQTVPPPKVAPRAIAAALVRSLREGTEDVFVGDVAEDIRRRLADNPKALERELGA